MEGMKRRWSSFIDDMDASFTDDTIVVFDVVFDLY